ncbi:MAG: magnesium transporter [Myxococcota bacterium]
MAELAPTQLSELLDKGDEIAVRALMAELPESDRTLAASRLPAEALGRLLDILGSEAAAGLIELLPLSQAAAAIEEVEPRAAAEILEALASDDRADVLAEVYEADRQAILAVSEADTAHEVRKLLAYDADTAGGLMRTEYVELHSGQSVSGAIEQIRRGADAYAGYAIQYLYAVDERGRLEGVVPLRALLLAKTDARLSELMVRDPVVFHVDDRLETLAQVFRKQGFLGAPVVDPDGRLVGVVERAAVDDAAIDVAESDHMKSLGIASGEELRSMPPIERSRRRLAWLSINILLNLFAASVVAAYQDTLQAAIALAVFLPIISDMSGCSGNQAVAVSLRELSLGVVRPSELAHVLGKEAFVGVLNGAALGAMLALLAWLWQGSAVLGAVVGLALALNTLFAVSIGGTTPLVIKRLGWDPALASGPILTTLTDVCGFFLTLQLATTLLL